MSKSWSCLLSHPRSAFFAVCSLLLIAGVLFITPAYSQEIEFRQSSLPKALVKSDSLLMQGRNEAALSIIEEYLNQQPSNTQALLRKAKIETQMGQFSKAETTLQKAFSKNQQNADVLEAMARFYYVESTTDVEPRNRLANADSFLGQALEINPGHIPSLTTQALVKMEQNDLITAEQLLRQALARAPRYVPALRGMARLYMKSKDWTNARYAVSQALEIEPNSQENYFLSAQLLATADYPSDAIQYALKSESLDYGKNLNRDYLIATQYEKLGELEKAVPYHQRILETHPRFAPSWQRLGEIYHGLNRPEQSRQAYQQAIAIDPSWFESLKTNAIQAVRQGNLSGAIQQIEKVTQIQPELAPTYQPLLANIQYFLSVEKALANPAIETTLPLERLPIDNGQSFDEMKLALGKVGYVAGFILPSSDNGTQALLSLKEAQQNSDPITRTEALFLANDFKGAKSILDGQAENLFAEQYAVAGDRLLLLRYFLGARILYQRAIDVYQIEGAAKTDPNVLGIRQAIQRLDQKVKQAERKVGEGDGTFSIKQYDTAVRDYLAAAQIDPLNDTAYLRMIDTLDKLRGKLKLKETSPVLPLSKTQVPVLTGWAYQQALQLSPNLLDSKGFNKKYLQETRQK